MNPQQQANHDTDRIEANRIELVDRILRVNCTDGKMEPLPGLFFNRISTAMGMHGISEPAFCVVAQGSKMVFTGDERYLYDPAHYLLFTAELPYVSQANVHATNVSPLDANLLDDVTQVAPHLVVARKNHDLSLV